MLSKPRRDAEFSDFVQKTSAELLRVAWYLTGDVHRAYDLVQASLVKTYLAWHRIHPGGALAYTRRIITNERTDQWRRTRAEVLTDSPADDADTTADAAGAFDTTDALITTLRRLPLQQRRVVVLRYYCDLSERQVAHELGISTGAVKSNASRGLAALRQHIAQQEWSHDH